MTAVPQDADTTDTERMVTKSWMRRSAGAVTALLLLAGCGSAAKGADGGDCNVRIKFQGNVFRGHNLVNELAPMDNAESGTGAVLDCDGTAVDHVAIHRVRGVAADVAIVVVGRKWLGVYVREGTGPSDWPWQLRVSHT